MVRTTVVCPEISELGAASFNTPPYASSQKTMFLAFPSPQLLFFSIGSSRGGLIQLAY